MTISIDTSSSNLKAQKKLRAVPSKGTTSKQQEFNFTVVKPAQSNPAAVIGKTAQPSRASFPGLITRGKQVAFGFPCCPG